jgi:RNA 2',3'-cyclic 3'-phosphodiesterase
MRLFVGIALPDGAAQRLAQAARRILAGATRDQNAIRWTQPKDMHVTLSFLGNVEAAKVAGIEQALSAISASAVPVELDGAGVFANGSILIAKVKSVPSLLELASEVVHAMEAVGFPREDRPYRPHVTLARMKTKPLTPTEVSPLPEFSQSFSAREFHLYESSTRSSGARYEVLRSFSLD